MKKLTTILMFILLTGCYFQDGTGEYFITYRVIGDAVVDITYEDIDSDKNIIPTSLYDVQLPFEVDVPVLVNIATEGQSYRLRVDYSGDEDVFLQVYLDDVLIDKSEVDKEFDYGEITGFVGAGVDVNIHFQY